MILLGIVGAIAYTVVFCVSLFAEGHFIFPFKFLNPLKDYRHWRKYGLDYYSILGRDGQISRVTPKNLPTLEFDKFLDLYSINPKKYDIDGTYTVKYNESSKHYNCYQAVFTFSYFDWLCYDAWKKSNEKQKATFENDKRSIKAQVAMYDMLKDVEQDIEKLKKKSQQEQEEAASKIVEVLHDMGKNGFTNEQVLNALEHFCDNFDKSACGRGRSSGESSCSKARPTSPPRPDMTLIANWPDYIEWEDLAGRRWYQQRRKEDDK